MKRENKMGSEQVKSILAGIFSVVFIGGMSTYGINQKCASIPSSECGSLWALLIIATLGGVLLTETLSKQHMQNKNNNQINPTEMTNSSIWARSGIRIILSSIMLGLPIIYQGAFVASFGGLIFGLTIVILVRAIKNQPHPFD